MDRPYRIGMICGSLAQAGTERYIYELCRGLDKRRFAVDVLTIAPWGIGSHFYAQPIRELGCRIRPIFPLFYFRGFPKIFRPPALAMQALYRSAVLPRILAKYDLLAVVLLDYLPNIEFMLPPDCALVVHLTTHLCQYDYDYYSRWPRHRRGFVVCMDNAQAAEAVTGLGDVIIDKSVVPLPMDCSQFEKIDFQSKQKRLIIGCFMRIERDRHPMPILRSFAALAGKTDAELLFYGRGDASHLRIEAERLGISDRVQFPGHVHDIRQTVIDDGVNLAWSTSHDGYFGYAGVELALLGMPTYFYNVGTGKSPERISRETDGAVYSYTVEADLAEATLAAWRSPGRLSADAARLRGYVQKRHDSKYVIRDIQAFYLQVIHNARSDQAGHITLRRAADRVGA
jgi:glycosyltransferase involved in cell wall biosynthesis